MKHVALIGCGNIGSRHLQGLLKINQPIQIDIIEPNEVAKRKAKLRIKEIPKKIKHEVNWYKSINKLKEKYDLTIIATTSKNRIELFLESVKKGNKFFVLEKIVCQSSQDYLKLLEIVRKNKLKVWINLPRRYIKSYIELKKILKENDDLFIDVTAGNIGLGTNSIHFLELFAWFTDNYKIKLNGKNLQKIHESKNGEFLEFSGQLVGKVKNNSVISIKFFPEYDFSTIIEIYSKNFYVVFDELNSKVILKKPTDKKFNFKMELVSDLSSKIFTDILKKKSCNLVKANELKFIHDELFRVFNHHIKKNTGKVVKKCPIT